ncbi:hypothetical protein [Burkholderia gladioli]|uniref:hypothetical protein n=2 Tax=Burkholderia gladioli TaxID=28095 RepID=UPI00163FDB85|nr:hypothetical protein [Burkholderia gladioli]MBJ9659842.1 hypothetical protein [Burkholderia gladioli]
MMKEKQMSLLARRVCECLAEAPGLTATQVAVRLDAKLDAVKHASLRLVLDGYVARGHRGQGGHAMTLTGKEFPRSADFIATPEAERAARLERELVDTVRLVVPAFHAMCAVGRATA